MINSSRRVKALLLALPLLIGLTGCWDNQPLETRTLVLAMGFYPGPNPHMITVDFSFPTPSGLSATVGGSSEGGTPSTPFTYVSGSGYSLAQAFSAAQAKTARDLYLGHTVLLTFSTKLSPKRLSQMINSLTRIGTLDKTPFVTATSAPFDKVVSMKMRQAQFPALYFEQLFSCTTCTKLALGVRFWQMSERLATPGVDLVLPVLSPSKEGVAVREVALYRHTRFITFLSPAETDAYGIAAGLSHKSSIFMPKYWEADLNFLAGPSSVTVKKAGGHIKALVSLNLTATLESLSTRMESVRQLSKISRRASAIIASQTLTLLEKTQQLDVDPLGVGRTLSWYSPNEFFQYPHWHEEYPHVQFTVHCLVKINKMGDIR